MSLSKFNVWREGMGNENIGNSQGLKSDEQQELDNAKSNPDVVKLSAAAKTVLNNLHSKLHTFTKNPKVMEHFLSEIIKSVMDAAGVKAVNAGARTGIMNVLKGR